jgi:Carboxypeptidase regulatory-like domain
MLACSKRSLLAVFIVLFCFALAVFTAAQTGGNSGSINGVVVDSSGAVIADATVEIHNPVSGYDRTTTTDGNGTFSFPNVPFNPYHMTVAAKGFVTGTQDIELRSTVPTIVKISLQVTGSMESVTVEANGGDMVENDSTFHTDVDRKLFARVPLESQSSSLSSLVTLTTPGIAADSNGLFHGLGDHAQNSFSVDGQPITDQVSKVFSNQLPVNSIQSMEVIAGAPPAEYGGKTSVVIVATTRSGQGVTTPHGNVTTSYGTFGTSTVAAEVAYGGKKWGNFISADGLNTGRFLDPPEFVVLHAKGNEENLFDRADLQFSDKDSLHLNLGFTRSWFQTPNSFDQQLQTCTVLSADCNAAGTTVVDPITGNVLGPTDQRSQIRTFNIAPAWTHLYNSHSIFTLGAFVRRDQYNYYPSNNPFSDLGPLQDETVSQLRFLTNTGIRGSWSFVKGIHNIKAGAVYEQTFLNENDAFGIVNPGLLPSCAPALAAQCATLAPYNLTTGGTLYHFRGHTDVKELALYEQDTITKGAWNINIGLRADLYNGLGAVARQLEPRAGIAYNVRRSNTVLQVSYARTQESPFNENLILSGTGCSNPVVNAVMVVAQTFPCTQLPPLTPGLRNEFHAGLEQAFGKYFVLSGEYIWKYTHNAYDFNVFGTTPITLPIEWHNSKIPGFAVRGSVPNFHGVTAFIVMSHITARFFPPTVSGIAPPPPPAVFRIDHDEVFNQTTHIQYQPSKNAPWLGFNWRYDSGLVAGFVPCQAQTATCSFSTSINDPGGVGLANIPAGYIALVNNLNGLSLTADQQFQSGLICNGMRPTPTVLVGNVVPGEPYRDCLATQLTSSLVRIPAPNTQQDDHNPQRIQPRNLFDLSLGDDNLFHGDKYKISLQLTAINITNKYALYNFLSTFSGTHYVTPRTLTAQLGFHF